MAGDLVIRNARMVLPGEVVEGSIAVADGIISGIDTGAGGRAGIDFGGDDQCCL